MKSKYYGGPGQLWVVSWGYLTEDSVTMAEMLAILENKALEEVKETGTFQQELDDLKDEGVDVFKDRIPKMGRQLCGHSEISKIREKTKNEHQTVVPETTMNYLVTSTPINCA